jgi:hypothetical protein
MPSSTDNGPCQAWLTAASRRRNRAITAPMLRGHRGDLRFNLSHQQIDFRLVGTRVPGTDPSYEVGDVHAPTKSITVRTLAHPNHPRKPPMARCLPPLTSLKEQHLVYPMNFVQKPWSEHLSVYSDLGLSATFSTHLFFFLTAPSPLAYLSRQEPAPVRNVRGLTAVFRPQGEPRLSPSSRAARRAQTDLSGGNLQPHGVLAPGPRGATGSLVWEQGTR